MNKIDASPVNELSNQRRDQSVEAYRARKDVDGAFQRTQGRDCRWIDRCNGIQNSVGGQPIEQTSEGDALLPTGGGIEQVTDVCHKIGRRLVVHRT